MRKPLDNAQIFKRRRDKVIARLGSNALLVSSQPEAIRNGSVHHPYRQDSNLYYLTGFEEAESVLLICPYGPKKTVMFVRKKDPLRETWDGFRYGPEMTQDYFQIDEVHLIEELPQMLPQLLRGAEGLYYRLRKDAKMDQIVFDSLEQLKLLHGRSGMGLLPLYDANEFLGESRVIKSAEEIEIQRQACQLTSEAHADVMRFVSSAKNERELQGFFIYQIMKRGAAREGYGTIVAGGANACTLHYVFNDEPLRKKDLLLIDAGGEYHYQTADITRTYPISGNWSDEQLQVYEGVLKIQKDLIAMVKPGLLWSKLQEDASLMLAELMLELGLLTGRAADVVQAGDHRKYYPHGIGHYLGLDVHDLGLYVDPESKQSRPLQEGMVLTIEPGLYIPSQDSSAYKGIGVRIEDNILVTSTGSENLTKACPKEFEELAKIIGKGASL